MFRFHEQCSSVVLWQGKLEFFGEHTFDLLLHDHKVNILAIWVLKREEFETFKSFLELSFRCFEVAVTLISEE